MRFLANFALFFAVQIAVVLTTRFPKAEGRCNLKNYGPPSLS